MREKLPYCWQSGDNNVSYILEALQKSDRERQRGTVPDLSAEHDSIIDQTEPKNRWPLIFLVTIIACTGLISYVFWPSHRALPVHSLSQERNLQPPAYIVNPEAMVSGPSTESVVKMEVLPMVPRQQNLNRQNLDQQSLYQQNSRQQKPQQQSVDTVSAEPMPVRRVALSKPTAVTPRSFENEPTSAEGFESTKGARRVTESEYAEVIVPNDNGQLSGSVTLNGVDDISKADELALLARAREQLQKQANADARRRSSGNTGAENYHLSFPDIDELDPVVLNLLPDLEFTTHIYSTESDKSFVMVNGKLLVEGENINSSLALVKILPEHVVMDFEGSQFRVESLKTWRK